jgi:2,5-furandicarboxylate decarboxylase 1
MQKDLRTIVRYLEEQNKLIRITREVNPEYEVTAVSKKIHEKYGKAVLFENVKGSSASVINYLYPDRETVAFALNMERNKMFSEWSAREQKQAPYHIVDTGSIKEEIHLDPNLLNLPLPTHCEGNAGAYITGGVIIARHPETGMLNASFNRCQLVNKDKLRVRMMPPQHLGICHEAAEKQGKPLEVAIVIGSPPALMFSAASKIPIDRDELEFSGALSTEPLDVVKCETNDVYVPADAEIVIEGKVMPGVREEEGPFGEFTDSFVPVMRNHVFQATAITHRKNPIYHDIFAGGKEDLLLLGIPIEAEIYNHIRKYANHITGIATTSFVFNCVIGIKKEWEEQPKTILLSALASYSWIRMAVVVDDDVDIYNAEDVLWAIQNRCRADSDLIVVPNVASYTREDVKDLYMGKFGFDATVPLNRKDVLKRRRVPLEETIHIEDYIES